MIRNTAEIARIEALLSADTTEIDNYHAMLAKPETLDKDRKIIDGLIKGVESRMKIRKVYLERLGGSDLVPA